MTWGWVIPMLASLTSFQLPAATLISLLGLPMVAGLLQPTTGAWESIAGTHLSTTFRAIVQNAVLVTTAGQHIEINKHLLAPILEANQQQMTSTTHVYLPFALGGAADWDLQVPKVCFHVLSGDYLSTFPEYHAQLR